jgi:outer membrane protein assembly factor BamB
MKKNIIIIVGMLFLSVVAAGDMIAKARYETTQNLDVNNESINTIDDLSTRAYQNTIEPIQDEKLHYVNDVFTIEKRDEYPIGATIWQYTITGSYDTSPKAIASIPDINDDDIGDVIICSEDDTIRCFDGSAVGSGIVLWSNVIYAGDVYNQNGIDILEDIDGDGHEEVVVGAAWGARLIRCISGDSGTTIWEHDTHEYGDGGWVYMVSCKYDYDDDGINDVLAAVGDDSSDTGPKRVYCLDGETGTSIWEHPLGGPGFSVIGVEDFTGDDKPDVIAGCSNAQETTGFVKALNGATGTKIWEKTVPGSSVWALEQADDFTSDGIKDVIIGDFTGHIMGLDATDGTQVYYNNLGSAIITRFAKLTDVNNDGHPDFVPAHSTLKETQAIDGQTGETIWAHTVADQPWNVARSNDISGDGIDDVIVGTLYTSNYCYFLDGTDGSEIHSLYYNQPVDAIMTIPDVIGDYSMEVIAGGREGKVMCMSGGTDTFHNDPPTKPVINGPSNGTDGMPYEFSFNSTDPDDDQISYVIRWGDGQEQQTDTAPSGEEMLINHTYQDTGNYSITAKAIDEYDYESPYSEPFEIQITENNPPAPPTINGPNKGKPGKDIEFKFTVTDPENDQTYIYIDWGDGQILDWIGPYDSGEQVTLSHSWSDENNYTIRAKGKDTIGEESEWATLEISIPRNKQSFNTHLSKLQDRLSILINIIIQMLRI